MKKILLLMGLLLSLGLFSACSSDDEIDDLMNQKRLLFEDSSQSIPEYDYTGNVYYDNRNGLWYICNSRPIDWNDYYYPLNLPDEFKKEGTTVSFSGKVVEMTDEERKSLHYDVVLGGHSYFFVYLTKIEKSE